MKLFNLFLGLAVCAVVLSGCDLTRNQLRTDRANNMEFQDYRDGLAPRSGLSEDDLRFASDLDDAGIPALESYMATPSEHLKPMPLVSISVNQTVPLRDILFELANQAGYDIELDPRIRGSIIFTAHEKPFDIVVGRISEMAGLRHNFEEDTLRVELDLAYNKTYKIDYLSFIRKNKSSISNDISVVTGEGADTGSDFEAASESEIDFWGELDANLTQILNVAASKGVLLTENDPKITVVEQSPAPIAPVMATGADGAAVVQTQAPTAVLQVSSLPSMDMNNATGSKEEDEAKKSSFSLNKQAGMVSVFATDRQHKEIQEFMIELRRSVTSQVLIEAKILEVSLSDEYSAGIDWSMIDLFSGELNFGFTGGGRPPLSPVTGSNFALNYVGNDLTAAVDAISRFGTVKALSSPRLTVLNNQSAVLNVAKNQVYFEVDVDIQAATADTPRVVTVDSQILNVPEGVLINVQPSIDLRNQSVSMAIRPTVTRIVEYVNDPGIDFIAALEGLDVTSQIPVMNVQEMDSIISMPSGQAVVMGGLMQDRVDSTETGVPIMSEIPLLGSLFKTHEDKVAKTELVIFLKATIMDGSNVHQTDKDLYRTFSGDRRPLNFSR